MKKDVEVIETTLGDLIEAIAQISLEAGKTEEEGYRLASMALESILRKNNMDLTPLFSVH